MKRLIQWSIEHRWLVIGLSLLLLDRKSTRLNSSHLGISYAVFCLKRPGTTEFYTLSLHDALPIFRAGVMPGDRVVTRGAYEIQLASAATGLPAEGHVH